MGRFVLVLVAALLSSTGCNDPESGPTRPVATGVDRDAELPPAIAEFLDDVAEPGTVAFRATYRVSRKLGGGETAVEVVAAPPSWQLRIDDLLVIDGPKPATCLVSRRQCVRGVRDPLLVPTGVFTGFFGPAPARALATDARRITAGTPVFSTRTAAGVELRCAAVPISGAVASTYCLTPDGIFGWVDTPAVQYELTTYGAGSPGEPVDAPYPMTDDDGFLRSPEGGR